MDAEPLPLARPDPPLEAEGILLRPPEASDVERIYELCQDPLVGRFTAVPVPYQREDALEYVARSTADWEAGSGAPFLITVGGEVVGSIGVFRKPWDGAVGEAGYWIGAEARGRGIATRALVLVTRWAFDAMGLARIQLGTNRENLASQQVAIKAGFQFEGILRQWREIRGERVDEVHFSLVRSDLTD